MNIARYSKAIGVLIVGATGWWASIIGGSTEITAKEWQRLGVVVAGVLVTYVLRNDPEPAKAKTTVEGV